MVQKQGRSRLSLIVGLLVGANVAFALGGIQSAGADEIVPCANSDECFCTTISGTNGSCSKNTTLTEHPCNSQIECW